MTRRRLGSFLQDLRRHASWLVVLMGLGVCVPVMLAPWQAHAGLVEIEAEADPAESNEETQEKSEHVSHYFPAAAEHLPVADRESIVDVSSPAGCLPDAPPTPPPDRNA